MISIKRLAIALVALLPWITHAESLVRSDRPLPVFSAIAADNIVIEIDPRIELLSGVQSGTSWIKKRGPDAKNEYYQALSALFTGASALPAIRECEALIRRGFTYDAPPAMALSLDGGEAFRAPAEGWSEYLKSRAGGAKNLDRFREKLAKAYDELDFRAFLEAHEQEYRLWIREACSSFDFRAVSDWLDAFYGTKDRPIYHFVLAPAMFPAGGYGFWLEKGLGNDKRRHVYQIVRAQGANDGSPGFPSGKDLASLALHEFGHSFVNPALESQRLNSRLKRIYKPVERVMRDMAYSDVSSFLNELIIRAATIIGQVDLGMITERRAEGQILQEELLGFYPIRRVIEILGEYRDDRAQYADFATFAPVLLKRLSEDADTILVSGAATYYGGSRTDAIKPVASFSERFDAGKFRAVHQIFAVGIGSSVIEAEGGISVVSLDSASGSKDSALKIEAVSDTSSFLFLRKSVIPKRGELRLTYRARGEGIRKEGTQYGDSYIGFMMVDNTGSKSFVTNAHSGTFEWDHFYASATTDPKKVKAIDLVIFLNESGSLWVDDIEVAYR